MLAAEEKQAIIDNEHLKILGICFYVMGGLAMFYSLIFGAYGAFLAMISGMSGLEDLDTGEAAEVMEVFGMIGSIMGIVIVFILVMAALMLYVGWSLRSRKNLLLCQIVAGITCLSIPLGTLLGVFTLTTLSRPSVKLEFQDRM